MSIEDKSNKGMEESYQEVEKKDAFREQFKPIHEYIDDLKNKGFFQKLDNEFNSYKKIGVFGSYKGKDKKIINELCQDIAHKGFVVYTDKGYYHPSTYETFQQFITLFSDNKLKKLLNDGSKDEIYYQYVLPVLIDGAVCRLYPMRTQMVEVFGCARNNKPVLGFADNENINNIMGDKCNSIMIQKQSSFTIMNCAVEHIKGCPVEINSTIHCIFYNPYEITQAIKNCFIKKQWPFYSVTNYKCVFPFIYNFLDKINET